MNHEISEQDGFKVVSFDGDIDLETSPEARKVLLDVTSKGGSTLVNLSSVSYIDSSGVASLVEALQSARKKGGSLALVSVSEEALRVLQLGRLDRVFTIHDDVAAATAAG
ncbi:MAG: STAS domain-containing protein [Magnetovibrionaceae bacterium]